MDTTGAYILREKTGTSDLEKTVRTAVGMLADHQIPHLIAGGLAVQEHGYFRVTLDADIIVPDGLDAVEALTADMSARFVRAAGFDDTLQDTLHHIQVNLLPGGGVLKSGCQVPFPIPREVSDIPRFVTLEQLVSLKLDSWSISPTRRLRDKSDVVELIIQRKLPRDLGVDSSVSSIYNEIWDALTGET